MLVAMKGHPGCGKSRVARTLGKALGWPVLDKDDIRDCTLALQQDLHVPAPLLNYFSYQALWRLVGTQLDMGLSVIADCPLSRPSLFLSVASLATRHSMRLLIIECVASDSDEWKRRLEGRVAESMDEEDEGQYQETLGMMQDTLEGASCSEPCAGQHQEALGMMQATLEERTSSRKQLEACDEAEIGASNDFKILPQIKPGITSNRSNQDIIHDGMGSKGFEGAPYRSGWHKPGSWEGLQKLIQSYGNCWDYDTGTASCKKLVVDTTALHHDALVSGALKWIQAVSDETPAVTFLTV